MALLQISEPEESGSTFIQKQSVVGIDLGTTNSLVATVFKHAAKTLLDEQNRFLLPSIVHYGLEKTTVGYAAKELAITDSTNTIQSVKRSIGRNSHDHSLQNSNQFLINDPQIDQQPNQIIFKTVAGDKNAVQISADILLALKERAEAFLKSPLMGAVITVPAYFDDAQRQATKDAAHLAGIHVLRLLNEPTAAAIAYGLDQQAEGTYAIYDLGGGTFDLSVLQIHKGIFKVLSTAGDTHLGGDDFDSQLLKYVVEKMGISKNLSSDELNHLNNKIRFAKETLSTQQSVNLSIDLSGQTYSINITQEIFNQLITPLIQKTIYLTRHAINDAKLTIDQIDHIVLVGGATRMPSVQKAVEELFSQKPLCTIDPDQVVAIGAAMQADLLAGNQDKDKRWLLLDVTPLSLGVETMGGLVEKIIPRHATIPIARAQEFTTYQDGQTGMSIHVVQGERELVSECRSLAHFHLMGIPPMVAGKAKVRVTYQIDADGLLSVTAQEMISNVSAEITVKASYGLDSQEILRMLEVKQDEIEKDKATRQLRKAILEAKRIIQATQSALAIDGSLISNDEKQAIHKQLIYLENIINSKECELIIDATKKLNTLTNHFAAIRMNRSIQSSLSGQAIKDLD